MAIETTLYMRGPMGIVSRHLEYPNWRVWDRRMSHVSRIARSVYAQITGSTACSGYAYYCPSMESWVEGSPRQVATGVEQRPTWIDET